MANLLFDGPAGVLEGRLELPEREVEAIAVLCHPHPLRGGSMQNTLVVRAARALRSLGFATLRVNFRGVGQSTGTHDGKGAEVEDARAGLNELADRFGSLPAWAVGFSFGARTVCQFAVEEPRIERTILLALPVSLYGLGHLPELRQPSLLVFGELDEFGTAEDLPALEDHLEVHTIAGADHLFRGRTPLVEARVRAYANTARNERAPL
jgi:alpha/beta superfamily hydrolase